MEDLEDLEDPDFAKQVFVTLARPSGASTLRLPKHLLVIEYPSDASEDKPQKPILRGKTD